MGAGKGAPSPGGRNWALCACRARHREGSRYQRRRLRLDGGHYRIQGDAACMIGSKRKHKEFNSACAGTSRKCEDKLEFIHRLGIASRQKRNTLIRHQKLRKGSPFWAQAVEF